MQRHALKLSQIANISTLLFTEWIKLYIKYEHSQKIIKN